MAHRTVYPTRTGRYGTRMLIAGEPTLVSGPRARELIALGRATAKKPGRGAPKAAAPATPIANPLSELRAQYFAKTGKRAFNGWDADTLRAKIAGAE